MKLSLNRRIIIFNQEKKIRTENDLVKGGKYKQCKFNIVTKTKKGNFIEAMGHYIYLNLTIGTQKNMLILIKNEMKKEIRICEAIDANKRRVDISILQQKYCAFGIYVISNFSTEENTKVDESNKIGD